MYFYGSSPTFIYFPESGKFSDIFGPWSIFLYFTRNHFHALEMKLKEYLRWKRLSKRYQIIYFFWSVTIMVFIFCNSFLIFVMLSLLFMISLWFLLLLQPPQHLKTPADVFLFVFCGLQSIHYHFNLVLTATFHPQSTDRDGPKRPGIHGPKPVGPRTGKILEI